MQTIEEKRAKRREYLKEYYLKNKKHIQQRTKKHRLENIDRERARTRKYRADNLEAVRAHDLLRCRVRNQKPEQKAYNREYRLINLYGIDSETYNEMFAEQEGRCSICGTHQTELKTILCVDHSHSTGKVRGLLCAKCNSLLGYAEDNPEILKSAIEYLKNSQN